MHRLWNAGSSAGRCRRAVGLRSPAGRACSADPAAIHARDALTSSHQPSGTGSCRDRPCRNRRAKAGAGYRFNRYDVEECFTPAATRTAAASSKASTAVIHGANDRRTTRPVGRSIGPGIRLDCVSPEGSRPARRRAQTAAEATETGHKKTSAKPRSQSARAAKTEGFHRQKCGTHNTHASRKTARHTAKSQHASSLGRGTQERKRTPPRPPVKQLLLSPLPRRERARVRVYNAVMKPKRRQKFQVDLEPRLRMRTQHTEN